MDILPGHTKVSTVDRSANMVAPYMVTSMARNYANTYDPVHDKETAVRNSCQANTSDPVKKWATVVHSNRVNEMRYPNRVNVVRLCVGLVRL